MTDDAFVLVIILLEVLRDESKLLQCNPLFVTLYRYYTQPGKPSNPVVESIPLLNIEKSSKPGPTKLGLNGKIAPTASKSPINKTNMATGKPVTTSLITAVSSTPKARVVSASSSAASASSSHSNASSSKSSNNNTNNNNSASSHNTKQDEKYDNKKNETIEKKKKEEKSKLKAEKEARKVNGKIYHKLTTEIY